MARTFVLNGKTYEVVPVPTGLAGKKMRRHLKSMGSRMDKTFGQSIVENWGTVAQAFGQEKHILFPDWHTTETSSSFTVLADMDGVCAVFRRGSSQKTSSWDCVIRLFRKQ